MKKILLAALGCLACAAVHAQDVVLHMTDGTTLSGYARTNMVNNVRFFEISDTPKGQRVRYDNDQIDRIVFTDNTEFVKHDFYAGVKRKKAQNGWLRVDYRGRGITLYSAYYEKWEQAGNVRKLNRQRNYYLAMGDDIPVWACTHYLSGGVVNQRGANRMLLKYYFSKIYPQYSDLAARVDAKEFEVKESPIEVVRAWEEAYAK